MDEKSKQRFETDREIFKKLSKALEERDYDVTEADIMNFLLFGTFDCEFLKENEPIIIDFKRNN